MHAKTVETIYSSVTTNRKSVPTEIYVWCHLNIRTEHISTYIIHSRTKQTNPPNHTPFCLLDVFILSWALDVHGCCMAPLPFVLGCCRRCCRCTPSKNTPLDCPTGELRRRCHLYGGGRTLRCCGGRPARCRLCGRWLRKRLRGPLSGSRYRTCRRIWGELVG